MFGFNLSNRRFGRKPVMFVTLAFQSISAIIAVFSPFWSMFAFFYFITGFGRVSCYVSAFVLGKYSWSLQSVFFLFYFLLWSVSILYLCHLMQFCRHWGLEWQSTSPVFIIGGLFELYCWLYVAASVCLLYKGLEIFAGRYFFTWSDGAPSLVVGWQIAHFNGDMICACYWSLFKSLYLALMFRWLSWLTFSLG